MTDAWARSGRILITALGCVFMFFGGLFFGDDVVPRGPLAHARRAGQWAQRILFVIYICLWIACLACIPIALALWIADLTS